MGLSIEYDLNGCHGEIRRKERTNFPSLLGLALGLPLLGVFLALLWFVPIAAPVFLFFIGAFVLGGQGNSRNDPHYYEKEGPALNWVFAKREVARKFSVEDRILSFDSSEGEVSCPLQGAVVDASQYGLIVSPTIGDPVTLFWDDATDDEVHTLYVALTGATAKRPEAGTERDVPSELRQIGTLKE